MKRIVSAREALEGSRNNEHQNWNRSKGSAERSDFATDASTRIYDSYARLVPDYSGKRLERDGAVFAMGSCFAREIESALRKMGGNVISVDETIDRDEFRDDLGRIRNGFFHRFTPRSMLLEFQAAFGKIPGWDDGVLMVDAGKGTVIDLNYWSVSGASATRADCELRRKVAGALVRRAAEAEVVILTLGLTEAWFHKPSGLYANFMSPKILARSADDFELHFLDFADTVECLEGIRDILHEANGGRSELVVTVSPVPLGRSFTDSDVIIANMDSKATLRAAAREFANRHDRVTYFPSYEMVKYTAPELAWRPDRVHIDGHMVAHIVRTFVGTYYEDGAFDPPAAKAA